MAKTVTLTGKEEVLIAEALDDLMMYYAEDLQRGDKKVSRKVLALRRRIYELPEDE